MERVEHVFVNVNIYFNVDSESGRVGSMVCEHEEVQPKTRGGHPLSVVICSATWSC